MKQQYRPLELKILGRIDKHYPNFPLLFLKNHLRRAGNKKFYARYESKKTGHYYSLAAFDYYRCIFVHIPKTGGLSVLKGLFGNAGGFHTTAQEYQEIFSPKTFRQYYKFSFVRNPYDRIVSAFFFLKNGGLHSEDARWADENIATFDTFNEFVHSWVNTENVKNSLHFIPQIDFVKNSKGQFAMDFIGKFESFNKDFEYVANKIGAKNKSLPHNNKSTRNQDYKTYYDKKSIEIIDKVYAEDLQAFDYSFEA